MADAAAGLASMSSKVYAPDVQRAASNAHPAKPTVRPLAQLVLLGAEIMEMAPVHASPNS